MVRSIPPLKAVRYFELAAEHESFVTAAEHLRVSKGAISQQIKQLEQFLGVSLFRRTGRRVVLTDDGLLEAWQAGHQPNGSEGRQHRDLELAAKPRPGKTLGFLFQDIEGVSDSRVISATGIRQDHPSASSSKQ